MKKSLVCEITATRCCLSVIQRKEKEREAGEEGMRKDTLSFLDDILIFLMDTPSSPIL